MFSFIIWAIGVALTFIVAEKNGRNKWLALFWGILFSWLALIVYAIMGLSFEKRVDRAMALTKAATPVAETTPAPAQKTPRKRTKKAEAVA